MSWFTDTLAALAVTLGLGAAPSAPLVQGYVEGEYLRIAPPVAGTLQELAVARGQTVTRGEPLFTMDLAGARAERARLAAALAQARAQLADLTKGRRPEELAVVAAQQAQAEAALAYSHAELKRQEALVAR
ncbi:MAG TPA: biotin/lipoyl-binding protein, partial [Azospirillum sp.]